MEKNMREKGVIENSYEKREMNTKERGKAFSDTTRLTSTGLFLALFILTLAYA